MRTFLFLLLLFFGTSVMGKEFIAKGKTYTAMGNYQITICDHPCVINGDTLKTFTIMYDNSPMEVVVGIREFKNQTTYIVTSEKISLTYVQTKKHFGVDKIIEGDDFNKEEFYHQKILTSGQSEKESLKLVAAYFPFLLKDNQKKLI